MRNINIFFFCWLMAIQLYGQNTAKPAGSGQLRFIPASQVFKDLQQNGKASAYFEKAQDLIYLDETLIAALNAIQADAVTPENVEMIKYINGRDQKPYREVWDHNVYMKYGSGLTDIKQLLTDADALADLKKRLGREFYRLDAMAFISGADRIMFILRTPEADAGSFYRAILTNGSIRLDEISNWRD
ncbi:MAG: hypothetical protein NTW31_08050 [Bacteroidetes bacterium]|nr:hypothetical protein [Bacteroidota bacterium]